MKLNQYNYIAAPQVSTEVVDWFRALPYAISEIRGDQGLFLHFPEFGEVQYYDTGLINGLRSPVVSVHLPTVRHDILWTVGEVNFLTTALSKAFPHLNRVKNSFEKWLSSQTLIFSHKGPHEFDYYLEGGSRNFLLAIYAFDSGMRAINSGQYFVSHRDSDVRVSEVYRQLQLRGVVPLQAQPTLQDGRPIKPDRRLS